MRPSASCCRNLRDLPGRRSYMVQPFVNVYTKFARADGHTVWLHMDQWEGQHWQRSPGNLYGDPVKISYDPSSSAPIKLVADKVIPPVSWFPPTMSIVKRIKIQSQILHQVVGPADLFRVGDDPAAEGLRQAPLDRERLSDRLLRRALLARRTRRLWQRWPGRARCPRAELHRLLERRRHTARDPRHAAASVAVLRRFVWRQLGEQRPLRRCNHAGAGFLPVGDKVPCDWPARGHACSPAVRDRRLDPSATRQAGDVSRLLCWRHLVALPRWRRLSLSPDRERVPATATRTG